MIQELSDKVWNNPEFQAAASRITLTWLRRELGLVDDLELKSDDGNRLIRAAAILACSADQEHRRTAFRIATCAYELFGSIALPMDQGLRVVLARLGNFPSFSTREDVNIALPSLPLTLAAEEISSADRRQISVDGQTFYLTDFQHQLWENLIKRSRISLSAPTSAGKSFVLEHYLSSLFESPSTNIVIYLVPTRALIAQVSNDLIDHFRGSDDNRPVILTIPVDPEKELPNRAIYVLTQERLQLALNAHSSFRADVVVVDEAHSIADGSRGILLQWVIDDLLNRNSKMQTLFASPTIRNLELFGKLFGLTDISQFSSVEPTVAQNFLIVSVHAATKGRISVHTVGDGTMPLAEVTRLALGHTIASRIDKLVYVAAALGKGQSNIIYANGAADTEKIALLLSDLFSERESNDMRLALSDLAKEVVHPSYVLSECVRRGVGFHYSNMPTQLRRAIEEAVSNGTIDYLVCTSTLLQGVNLPVKNIFMCAPEKGRGRPLESIDFWNLSGRAGRLRREFQGNIFLIDYENWKKKPLGGPKDVVVIPAIETSIREHHDQLITVIGDERSPGRSDEPDLETTFVRLYSDLKRGELSTTLERIGIGSDSPQANDLSSALIDADTKVSIPAEIIRRTPNISAHKQQRLFNRIKPRIDLGADVARAFIPRHPREIEAFQSYADILELCHEVILGLDTTRGLHRFYAVIARKWMQGLPLPRIIDEQIVRNRDKIVQTTIRETLELIETQIRFQTVRLFGCYINILSHALLISNMADLVASIPSLPLYLEVGASDRTMISFISLGLSRVTAMKLNDLSARKNLDVPEALQWLRGRPLLTLGLSPLLLAEVQAVINQ